MLVTINKELSGELIPLTSMQQLEEIDRRSGQEKVIIFKHSTRCGISHAALEEVEQYVSGDQTAAFYYLDLLVHRDISDAISERYRVPHHSPQVLIIQAKEVINQATHAAIDVQWLMKSVG